MIKVVNYLLSGISALVEFGKGGGWFGWNSTDNVFKATTSDTTTLARVQGANAVNNDEFATLAQVSSKAPIVISGGYHSIEFETVLENITSGAISSADVAGKYYMCTDHIGDGVHYIGEIYTLNETYTDFINVPLEQGQLLTFAVNITTEYDKIQLEDYLTSDTFDTHSVYIYNDGSFYYTHQAPIGIYTQDLACKAGVIKRLTINNYGNVIKQITVNVNQAQEHEFNNLTLIVEQGFNTTEIELSNDIDLGTVGTYEIPLMFNTGSRAISLAWLMNFNNVAANQVLLIVEFDKADN